MMNNLRDMYDADGYLSSIDVYEDDGTFIISAVWDENDEHTEEMVKNFRAWVNSILATKLAHDIKQGLTDET
jgi:hypothetical protein